MFVEINRDLRVSTKKQLYDGITSMILNGTLMENEKLPPTRQLARQLNIARNTVIEIYEQLVAEAYLYSIQGKGTFVATLRMSDSGSHPHEDEKTTSETSMKDPEQKSSMISFVAGTPDLNHFPARQWIGYVKDYLYGSEANKLGYESPQGYTPLRQVMVQYLRKHKGIDCTEKQIFITNGTSGALNIIGMVMKKSHGRLLSESPVMDFVPEIFRQYDYPVVPLAVDQQGIVTEQLHKEEDASLIYASPSHQFPLGGTLPIDRRQMLLQYADEGHHIIIEDDYDSEFRYSGAPVNALKQIGPELVIYLGTFSKTMAPGLRVGYMVVPGRLVERFRRSYESTYRQVQTIDQYALYRMIAEGQYEQHIYKMLKIYKKKYEILKETIRTQFGEKVQILGSASGLHVALKFPDREFSIVDQKRWKDHGIEIELSTDYLIEQSISPSTDTLIIGFGHLSHGAIEAGMKNISLLL